MDGVARPRAGLVRPEHQVRQPGHDGGLHVVVADRVEHHLSDDAAAIVLDVPLFRRPQPGQPALMPAVKREAVRPRSAEHVDAVRGEAGIDAGKIDALLGAAGGRIGPTQRIREGDPRFVALLGRPLEDLAVDQARLVARPERPHGPLDAVGLDVRR